MLITSNMKRQILTFAILTCSYLTHAQISFGVKAGINFNSISASSSLVGDTYKSNLAFHLGVFGQLKLKEKFFLIPELQFNQRGAFINNPPNSDVRLNLNYIDLPVLLSYQTVKQINIDLGPNISFKTSATATSGNSTNNVDKLYGKDVEFGISTGLRLNLSDKISIIGRYYHGITAIDEITYVDANNSNKTTITFSNRTLQFGLSYKLLN